MKKISLQLLLAAALAATLVACGGGGSDAGVNPNSASGNAGNATPTPAPGVATLLDVTPATASVNAGGNITITVVAKNSTGVVQKDVPITLSNSGNNGSISPPGLTGADGKFTATFEPGNTPVGTVVTVTATANAVGTTQVTGTSAITITSTGPTPTPTPIPNLVAASSEVTISNRILATDGSNTATLTVTTLNSARSIIGGIPVSVTLDAGIFTPNTSDQKSDSSGKYSGTIELGSIRKNGIITATITTNSGAALISKTETIAVTGNKVNASNLTTTIAAGSSITNIRVTLKDSADKPIGGETVSLTLPAGFSTTPSILPLTSFSDGSVLFNITAGASSVPGSNELIFRAGGTQNSQLITVVGGGAGNSVPDVPASTVISSASLSTNPTSITTNSVGDQTNRATLRAQFLDNTNNPIPNMRVRFRILSNVLGAEQLFPNDGSTQIREYTAYSDPTGKASVSYIPGTVSSPTDGVVLRACYGKTDAELISACAAAAPSSPTGDGNYTNDNKITVDGQAQNVAIFEGNKISPQGNANQTYEKTFVIQVVNASGVASANTPFTASVDITHFGKGSYYYLRDDPATVAVESILTPSGYPSNIVPTVANQPYDGAAPHNLSFTTPATPSNRIWCINEDVNRNASIDGGDYDNGNNKLDPPKAAISVVAPARTDSKGQATITISYGQQYATWLAYTLKVSLDAIGSEGTASASFVTDALKEDVDSGNGTFLGDSTFGTAACNSAN